MHSLATLILSIPLSVKVVTCIKTDKDIGKDSLNDSLAEPIFLVSDIKCAGCYGYH